MASVRVVGILVEAYNLPMVVDTEGPSCMSTGDINECDDPVVPQEAAKWTGGTYSVVSHDLAGIVDVESRSCEGSWNINLNKGAFVPQIAVFRAFRIDIVTNDFAVVVDTEGLVTGAW